MPVVIEGYSLPGDDRLRSLSVTPDPGVIEVNIHPSETWDELVERTDGLDDDARRLGLATEKFEIDGLHSGTAAAVTSRSADAPRPTARSCGARTSCAA